MSTASLSRPDDPRRKRVRKGTRSCWECKRRKIRCQLSSDDLDICEGCLARGTTCLGQDQPEEYDTPGNNQISRRLGRVELLLEKLLAKIEEQDSEEKAQKDLHSPESLGTNDIPAPICSNMAAQDNVTLLSLFDDTMDRRESAKHQSMPESPHMSGVATRSCRPSKIERHYQTLVDLLPSQIDTDLVCGNSSCWLLIRGFSNVATDEFTQNNNAVIQSTFNIEEVSKKHPTAIARTLLYIALCLQQLPSNFDKSLVHFPTSVKAYIDRLISTVQILITSDDDFVSTVEGLECLLLQGIYHTNGGNPKRAWLSFRRAGNIGQLMGIDKMDNIIPGGSERWYQIVQEDRYLSLLLGLQSVATDDAFGPEETFQNPTVNKDFLFCRKLAVLSARIIELRRTGNHQCYASVQQIVEMLESLEKDMPQSWWHIATFGPDFRSIEAYYDFRRLTTQIWYFQLEAVLHFPFMLRAVNERHFGYSKSKCLEAMREMVYRYLAMREVELKSFCFKLVDFGALAATVILILDLLEPPQVEQSREIREQKNSDRALVQKVMHLMEQLSIDGEDAIARRCVNVIKALILPEPGHSCGSIRVAIPYFGTININRTPPTFLSNNSSGILQVSPPVQSIPGSQQLAPTRMAQGSSQPIQHPIAPPIVSFTSSQSQFDVLEQQVQDWRLPEADTLFFDRLFSTDIEGNWIV